MAEAGVEEDRWQNADAELRVQVRFVLQGCSENDEVFPRNSSDCPPGKVQGVCREWGKGKGLPAVLGSPKELGAWQHGLALRAFHVDSHWVAEAWLPTGTQVHYVWVTVGAKNCLSHCDVMPPRLVNIVLRTDDCPGQGVSAGVSNSRVSSVRAARRRELEASESAAARKPGCRNRLPPPPSSLEQSAMLDKGRCPCVVLTAWGMADHTVVEDLVRVEVRTVYKSAGDERLAVGGTGPLGGWDPRQTVVARQYPPDSGFWSAELELGRNVPERWKWVVLDTQGRARCWERGPERRLVARGDYQLVSAPWEEEGRVLFLQEGRPGGPRLTVLQEQGTCTGDSQDCSPPAPDRFPQTQEGGSGFMSEPEESRLSYGVELSALGPGGYTSWRPPGRPARPAVGPLVPGQFPSTSVVHSEPQLSWPAPMTSYFRPTLARTFQWSVSRTDGSQSMPTLGIHFPRPDRSIGVRIALCRAGVREFLRSHRADVGWMLLGLLLAVYGHGSEVPSLLHHSWNWLHWGQLGK